MLLGDPGCGWEAEAANEGGDPLRHLTGDAADEVERLAATLGRPEEQAEPEHGIHRVKRKLELGDDAKVAAPAAQRPEEVGVLGRGRGENATVRGDHLRPYQVVAAQAKTAREP